MSPLQTLHPSVLVVADLAVGGLLLAWVSTPAGLLVVLAGLLVLCGVASEALSAAPVHAPVSDRR